MKGIQYEMIVWIIMGQWGILSECRHSSCSSFSIHFFQGIDKTDLLALVLKARQIDYIVVHDISFEIKMCFIQRKASVTWGPSQ